MDLKESNSTVKRDLLLTIEEKAQKLWLEKKFNEFNPIENQKKFFVTFPFPYANGKLHLGHAYSLTKCEFTSRFKRLNGYNVLFPFAFHCTGTPISASSAKLTAEFEEFGEIPALKENDKKRVLQYDNMLKMGIPASEIPKFKDPKHWFDYFPAMGVDILKKFGANVDFRRSFITTDKNPYFSSFIEWQFRILKEKGLIFFGKRPSVFSIKQNQICTDHDRAEGEGFNAQEYTLIKMQLLDFPGKLETLKGKKVFLPAATLRPETMYGQTNCFVLPTGNYGVFLMKNDEIFICSERSAKNMAYQDLTKEKRIVDKLFDIDGFSLLGLALKAPLSSFEKVTLRK